MEYLSPALRQPPLPDAEKKRLRELSRFYCTIPHHYPLPDDVSTPTPSDEQEPNLDVARLSSDITLTALTQLGVHRFGCMRSFVSLIDGQNQHIISEATASISLRDRSRHIADDGLYLGATTLDLVFGVCPHAVKLFSGYDVPHLQNTPNVTATSTRYIVRDFTVEEYFKDRPYVTEWPHFRFYAEVPLYSPSGHVLGSYCVVDNKPRNEFSEDDVTALQEISDAISLHLENVRTVHYHRRSDRLVRGLTSFVKDRPDHRNLLDTPASSRERRTSEPGKPETLPFSRLSLTSDPTGDVSPLFSNKDGADFTDATSLSVALQEPAGSTLRKADVDSPGETVSTVSSGKSSPSLEVKESVPLSIRIANVFAHASAVIQEAMDVDGVLFIDASSCNSGIVRSKTDLLDWDSLPKNADPNQSSYSYPSFPSRETPCDTLGLALNEQGPYNAISDVVLRDLITTLPQGGVLHPDSSSDVLSLEHRLTKCFPQAKSLLFIPLWDWNKCQWLAGTFVWTKDNDTERSLGLDELHYFKVFGDSIISEIARLDWSQKEKSKFDLISSVSHELRSPLHGMLANAELLAASLAEPEQQETVKEMETCGITLLDTMNHLLDFAKINNLTSIKHAPSSVTGLVSSFDLDVLMEEVVNSVFSGMRHAAIASTPSTNPASKPETTYKRDLSVVLRFEGKKNWKVNSMTGAWRRIVMNILGNALKYTDKGFVEISASLINSPLQPESTVAHLRFADSGHGMSQEFLRNQLFSPFSQEDSLSEGAGLGMSIVQQLVTFLKGSIDVKSEIGVGTQVDIFIPVQPEPVSVIPVSNGITIDEQNTTISLVGLAAYPELSEEPTGTLSPASKRKICLQSFFSNLLADQPGWTVSSVESLDDARGDITIIDETTLKKLHTSGSLRNHTEKKFVCLCDGMPGSNTDGIGAQIFRIYQPFSPRKVLRSLELAAKAKPRPVSAATAEVPLVPHISLTTDVNQSIIANNTAPTDPRVLIVDDNEINIKVLAKLMSKLGFQYTTATNGLIALNAYKQSPGAFRVVLMDVSMPIMDGIDATRHIRIYELENSLPPVKVYAVTGVASAAMQQEALMAGVDEYLVKPLSLHQLGKLTTPHL